MPGFLEILVVAAIVVVVTAVLFFVARSAVRSANDQN
jgi:hypothetical protein